MTDSVSETWESSFETSTMGDFYVKRANHVEVEDTWTLKVVFEYVLYKISGRKTADYLRMVGFW